MQPAHASTPPERSAFVAAVLSLLFPGLGHAYLGAYRRALGFAAPPILIGALIAGIVVRLDTLQLAGIAVQSWFLIAVFIVNLVALAYRAAAIVDAWRIATWLGRASGPRRTSPLRALGPLPVAGLAAVILVMSGVHIAIARYDTLIISTTACVFDPSAKGCGPTGTVAPGSDEPSSGPEGSAAPPAASTPPWNGTDRLNILLIGADEQGGGHNTDTMITVSIDPVSHQVVMFTLPRDTVDVPIPAGPARSVWGTTYPGKINSWYAAIARRGDLYPGGPSIRGYTGLKDILGNLYGLDIKYFVEVNFDGFTQVVDALGGVTVNVQIPVIDDRFPDPRSGYERLYIPAGMQHMDGAEALRYARSRHGSSDFDRGARQQRVLVSLRQQSDPVQLLPRIDALAEALKQTLRTDIPRELFPQLLGLAEKVDTRDIRSVIFTPPFYQKEYLSSPRGYIIVPYLDRIRAAVKEAFTVDPAIVAKRDTLAQEGATIWVLDGARDPAQARALAAYLDYLGMAASAPTQRPDASGLSATTIRVYNGAESRLPATLAELSSIFGVQATPVADPAMAADIVIITGKSSPDLTPPPAP
jgi:LCP family protein required for cell wall assembly